MTTEPEEDSMKMKDHRLLEDIERRMDRLEMIVNGLVLFLKRHGALPQPQPQEESRIIKP